ncbi:MAG: ShlB/FhaC/HecB family hemolysin secretion/activation protein [Polynucleobacter sp.]
MRILVLIGVLLNSGSLFAQTSAGQLLQQNRELEPTLPLLPDATRNVSPLELKPSTPPPGQVTFVVKQFEFTGNTKIPTSDLNRLAAGLINTPITFDDLGLLTNAITQYYRERGWLVRAVVPKQDITAGVVRIQLIEAKLGGISIDNRSTRVSNQRVEDWVYSHIPRSADLSLDQLDFALLTLNDLPDISVTSSLQSGLKPGDTILVLTVEDKPLFNGQVSVDNYGDANSGKVRTSVLANANGPLGIGDQLSVYGMYSEGNSYGRLSYTAPVGNSGLRMGINGSTMAYRVLNQSFNSLYANGIANTGGVEASMPLIRSRPTNLVTTFNWNYSEFKNWTIAGVNQDQTYTTSVAQLGLNGNRLDDIWGGGINTGLVTVSGGDISRNINGPYSSNYGVAGNFGKARYAFTRTQSVTDETFAYVSISGQWATKNMDSSEQLYLGGPMNVRAYGSGQGAASQGNLTTVELRQNLPYQTQVAGFYDIGNVQTWKFNPAINQVSNNYVIQGAGVSLAWLGPYNLSVKGAFAMRTGGLSPSVTQYLTQNGGISSHRFWVTATLPI